MPVGYGRLKNRQEEVIEEKMERKIAKKLMAMVFVAMLVTLVSAGTVNAGDIIFEDNFDSYTVGMFPSSGDWILRYNGLGSAYQIVDNSQSVSQPNSLKLEGRRSWAATADHLLSEKPNEVILEADIKVTRPDGGTTGWLNAYVNFVDPDVSWGRFYAGAYFGADKLINGIIPYNFDQWYHIKVKQDMTKRLYDVWIDNEHIGTFNVPIDGYYKAIRLDADNAGHTRAWFDNVKVYQATSVSATIDIDPDTLNLKSKGNWITAYIELPEGYDVADIDVDTILLEDTISAEAHPTEIGDYDNDGIVDLMVKFDRTAVQEILEVGEEVEITVTGELTDGTLFEGSDTIRVIDE